MDSKDGNRSEEKVNLVIYDSHERAFSNTYVSRLQKKPFKPVLCPTDYWKFNDKTISIVMSHFHCRSNISVVYSEIIRFAFFAVF